MWNQIKSFTSEVNNPPAGGQQHDGAANINTTETLRFRWKTREERSP